MHIDITLNNTYSKSLKSIKKGNKKEGKVYMRFRVAAVLAISIILAFLAGCGRTEIPVTSHEQLLSGITHENAAIVIDTVVDVFENPDVMSTRKTQVLYNQLLSVEEEKGDWTKVTLLNGDSGWLRSKYLSRDYSGIIDGSIENKIVVTAKNIEIYTGTNNSVKFKQVVTGTELYSFSKTNTGYEVFLPEGRRGWVEDGGVIAIPISEPQIKKTSTTEFMQTVKKFEGTIYLIGGISKWGIDSSGLVYISARVNGVDIPRDLVKMSGSGTSIDITQIAEGDLIFFSSTSDKKDVSDVGIYTGDSNFLHASKTRGVIQESLEDTYFGNRVYSIKRIF